MKLNYRLCYVLFGTAYGTGRSFFYLNQVNDLSLTTTNDVKYHAPTFPTKLLFTVCHASFSSIAWPINMLTDVGIYEKSTLGIKEKYPPFPFNCFEWKQK